MADPQSLLQPGETLGATAPQAPTPAPNPSDASSLLQPGETLGATAPSADNGTPAPSPYSQGIQYPAGTKYTGGIQYPAGTQYGSSAPGITSAPIDNPTNIVPGIVKEVPTLIKGIVENPFPGAADAAARFAHIPQNYRDYEAARRRGLGVIDAAEESAKKEQQRSDVVASLKQRIKEFETTPNEATGKLIADLAPMLLLHNIVGSAAEVSELPESGAAVESTSAEAVGSEAATSEATPAPAATATPKQPNIARQLIKGADVVKQPEIQGAVRSGVNAASEEAGASTVQPESIRDSASGHISALENAEDAAYKAQDEAAGTDIKQLRQNLDNAKYQKSLLTKTPADVAKAKDLDTSIQATQDEIDAANSRLQAKGIDPGAGDHLYKTRQAAQDFEDKVLHNQSVIKGDATAGQPETVDIDALVRESQKLYDKDKFGGSRLEQFMGKDGAANYMKQIRALQTAKMTAAARQATAFKVLNALKYGGYGLGALYGLSKVL